jgi:hypothetical protein
VAHNGYVRTAGTWATLSTLTSAELRQFDIAQFKAINGDDGGTWSPSSALILGGLGLKTTGPYWATGSFRVDTVGDFRSNVTVAGTGSVTGNLHCGAVIDADGGVTTHGDLTADGKIQVAANAVIGTTLVTGGNLTCHANLSADGNISAVGNLNAGGNLSVTGTTTLSGASSIAAPMSLTGAGHLNKRVLAAPDADTAVSVSTADYLIGNSIITLTADHLYSLDSTGAAIGSEFHVTNNSATKFMQVTYNGGVTSFLLKNASGARRTIKFVYTSVGWIETESIFVP